MFNPENILSDEINITEEIIDRDNWRIENYKESLRGYQVRKDILENMSSAIKKEDLVGKNEITIADVGCGPGICGEYLTKSIKENFKDNAPKTKTIFLDLSQQMLNQIPDREDYEKIKGDVTNIPLKNISVDIVTMKQVLDYLPKNLQIKTLSETNRILKQGGKLILSALISPSEEINNLTNELYSEREKLLAKKKPIEKFIPDESTIMKWLSEAGFTNSKVVYKYDIPLSTEDFKKSFNLTDAEQTELKELYKKIINSDKNNNFDAKVFKDDIELTEKAIILECVK